MQEDKLTLAQKPQKLTKKLLENLFTAGKRYEVRDTEVAGFLVRISANGDKSFYLKYRFGKGRTAPTRRYHIGTFPTTTVEQARTIAKEKIALVVQGHDPVEDVRGNKAAPRIDEAMGLFFEEHGHKIKASTLKWYGLLASKDILPAIGKKKVVEVSHRHIAALHTAMKHTPYKANRCIALLSKFFSWAELRGYRERNTSPVVGIEKYKEQKRTQSMQREELEALGSAFVTMEAANSIDPIIAAALKTLIFTGARCNEVLTMKWAYIDYAKGIAHLPDSKTGEKNIHLPPPAMVILNALPRVNEYCFYGRGGKGHIVNIKDTWKRLLSSAGLTGWRIHDLRHAFASYAVSSGKSLPVVGAMLGHSQPSTTQRYAHLQENPVATAAADTAAALLADFTGGKVLPFKKVGG